MVQLRVTFLDLPRGLSKPGKTPRHVRPIAHVTQQASSVAAIQTFRHMAGITHLGSHAKMVKGWVMCCLKGAQTGCKYRVRCTQQRAEQLTVVAYPSVFDIVQIHQKCGAALPTVLNLMTHGQGTCWQPRVCHSQRSSVREITQDHRPELDPAHF